MNQAALGKKSEWDKRVERAVDLAERFAYANEILTFYREVLRLQQSVYNDISSQPMATSGAKTSLRACLDLDGSLRYLPALLALAEGEAPTKLAEEAREMRATSAEAQRQVLRDFVAGNPCPHVFFARTLLQPGAEFLAGSYPMPSPGTAPSVCPLCGARPQAAVLRPEGEGGKRFLLCSLCLTEWEFRRVLCPVCGEGDYQKLPRYTAEEHDSVRVEACDTCHFYLKSIDMTIDGLAVPLVDEVASVPLDLWAAEHGYKKAESNLMGF